MGPVNAMGSVDSWLGKPRAHETDLERLVLGGAAEITNARHRFAETPSSTCSSKTSRRSRPSITRCAITSMAALRAAPTAWHSCSSNARPAMSALSPSHRVRWALRGRLLALAR